MIEVEGGPLVFLNRDLPGAVDPLTITVAGERAALLFSNEALARKHLAKLPAGYHLEALDASDLRAKEEFLQAALTRGAGLLYLDADLELVPEATDLTARALARVLAEKRQLACL